MGQFHHHHPVFTKWNKPTLYNRSIKLAIEKTEMEPLFSFDLIGWWTKCRVISKQKTHPNLNVTVILNHRISASVWGFRCQRQHLVLGRWFFQILHIFNKRYRTLSYPLKYTHKYIREFHSSYAKSAVLTAYMKGNSAEYNIAYLSVFSKQLKTFKTETLPVSQQD